MENVNSYQYQYFLSIFYEIIIINGEKILLKKQNLTETLKLLLVPTHNKFIPHVDS